MILTRKQTTSLTLAATLLVAAAVTFLAIQPVGAAVDYSGYTMSECNSRVDAGEEREECRRQVTANPPTLPSDNTSEIECGDGGVRLGVGINEGEDCVGGDSDTNPIFEYLGGIIRFLSVGVGVVVTAMIVIGGIQYSAAGGNPQAVEAAKSRISNAIIALVLYIFMVGILNFLVPGGVL